MLKKTPPASPTTEEKFNGASALAGAATSYFTGIVADLLNANAELGEVVDESSASIDGANDWAERQVESIRSQQAAEVERLTTLREAAISKTLENGVIITNLRAIVGGIAD